MCIRDSPGRLVEKDVLMKRIWPEAVVEEANLANNVSLLRKILAERNEQVQYIETVPRRGYRFLVDVVEHREEAPSVPPLAPVSYTHLRAHETPEHLVCRL